MGSPNHTIDAGAGIITLNSSASGNRLNLEFLQALSVSLEAVLSDSGVRVVIIRSNGAVFSLGLDFSAFTDTGKDTREANIKAAVGLYRKILYRLFSCGKPVVAVVQGDVKAGGVGLMCACDVVLGAEDASVELGEVIFGLIPANVLPYLLQTRVSLSRARYMILTAKRLKADQAAAYGIIDEVHPPSKMEQAVKKVCKQFFRSSPEALTRTKTATLRMLDTPMRERGDIAQEELINLLSNDRVLDGISRFQEGDLPDWFTGFSPEDKLVLYRPEETEGKK